MKLSIRMGILALCFSFTNCSSSSKVVQRDPQSDGLILDSSGYLYNPQDKSCGGFPKLRVETMPGTCLGLVIPRDRALDIRTKKPLIMPRTLVAIPNTKNFLLVDMGGWKENAGAIYWLKINSTGQYELQAIKTALNTPHGLALSPDGFYYVGESQQISRFHFSAGVLSDWQLVVPALPRFKGHMHPLTQFTFDPRNNDMFINSGAPSDHCFVAKNGTYSDCPEDSSKGLGAIYRVPGTLLQNIPPEGVRAYEVTAKGLRNSMAMVVHPSGNLIQGENARDFAELDEPYEEINVIDLSQPGKHYGWPYCYDYQATSPEWLFPENAKNPLIKVFNKPLDCSTPEANSTGEYQGPYALMPPHSAPLDMKYYHGSMFSELNEKLLVSWHGYQPTGHRLVAYSVDEKGRPLTVAVDKDATYKVDQPGKCPIAKAFRPQGGMPRNAPYIEVIRKWSAVKGERPKGAPVGFTEASDGSIWIAEDRDNRTIVRLARTPDSYKDSCEGAAQEDKSDPRIELLVWRNHFKTSAPSLQELQAVQSQLTQKYCLGCHGNFQADDIRKDRFSTLDFIIKNQWVIPGKPMLSKMYQASSQTGETPPMPPGGNAQFIGTPEGPVVLKSLSDWITHLPLDIESRSKRILSSDNRRFRDQANLTSSKICGQFLSGDAIYIDPRPSSQVQKDGWSWSKIYVVPDNSRFFYKECEYPEDGVFYMATQKL